MVLMHGAFLSTSLQLYRIAWRFVQKYIISPRVNNISGPTNVRERGGQGVAQAGSHSLSAGKESVQSSEGSSQLMPPNKHGLNKQAPFIRDVCILEMLNENCY